MSDAEIDRLKAAMANHRVLWNPDPDTARVVNSIGKHAEESDWGDCAIFNRGQYATLYNCSLSEFFIAQPIP